MEGANDAALGLSSLGLVDYLEICHVRTGNRKVFQFFPIAVNREHEFQDRTGWCPGGGGREAATDKRTRQN